MMIILHNIRSLYNVGSIFRTAEAAGVEKIYLGGYTPSPVDELGRKRNALVKVSLGAEDTIPWEKHGSTFRLLKKLRQEGFRIAAIEQAPTSQPFHKTKTNRRKLDKLALVLGNEISGIPSSVLKLCDYIWEIPMKGQKESLNVSVAFGIVVFNLLYKKNKLV